MPPRSRRPPTACRPVRYGLPRTCDVPRVLLVPGQPQQRRARLRALVNDGAVLLVAAGAARTTTEGGWGSQAGPSGNHPARHQALGACALLCAALPCPALPAHSPQVKHADRAVCRHRCKDADAAPRNVVHLRRARAARDGGRHRQGAGGRAACGWRHRPMAHPSTPAYLHPALALARNVLLRCLRTQQQQAHLLVVRDQLRVHQAALNVPDSAGGVDGGGAHAAGVQLVPVKRRQRRRKLPALILQQTGPRAQRDDVWAQGQSRAGRGGGSRREHPPATGAPATDANHGTHPRQALPVPRQGSPQPPGQPPGQPPAGRTLFSSFSRRTPGCAAPGSSLTRHRRRKSPEVASRSGRVPSCAGSEAGGAGGRHAGERQRGARPGTAGRWAALTATPAAPAGLAGRRQAGGRQAARRHAAHAGWRATIHQSMKANETHTHKT